VNELQVQTILSNQLMLWEQCTKMEWVDKDTVKCELVEGIMPDGAVCRGLIKCKSRRDAADQWFNYVRSQYDARTAEQEAKAAQRAEASRASGGEKDPAPGVDGGDKTPAEASVQDSETSVEDILQSKVAAIGRSIIDYTAARTAKMDELALLDARLISLRNQRAKAVAAIKAMRNTDDSDAS
jgi:hypothetical protein